MNMKNTSFMRLKQHRMIVGGVLLAIALSACSTSHGSQPSDASPLSDSSLPVLPSTAAQIPPSRPSPISTAQNSVSSSPQQEAVQVIQNYYSAINRQDYAAAYSTWEGNGTASQQSFEQFRQGFANTASTSVEVGQPGRLDSGAGSSYIEIPVTVTAVSRDGTQRRFQGSYVLRQINNIPGSTPEQLGWHFQSANLALVSTVQNPASSSPQQEAVQVIRDYYSAINRRDYAAAYSTWEGNGTASQQSFEQFRQGFANTASTSVEVGQPGRLEGAAGSTYIEIPVTVRAVTRNGTHQQFQGSYKLRRVNDVPGSTAEQRRWHLQSATLAPVR
jgi:hypothetical protein